MVNQVKARIETGRLAISNLSEETVPAINQLLVHMGLDVYELKLTANDLETVFMDLIIEHPHGLHQ
jgi:hypothetical protein